MEEKTIDTSVGRISVTIDDRGTMAPIIFLHGVFLDKSLWFEVSKLLPEITRIYIDLPAHGDSSDVGHDWALDDCVDMLMQIIDELKAVILRPADATQLINELRVLALAVIGRVDYVGKPPKFETWIAPGRHNCKSTWHWQPVNRRHGARTR